MRTITIWTAFMLAYSNSPLVVSIRYIDPVAGQSGNIADVAEKRIDLTEPTCEELRAMWRYTKRQSRAAKTTTGYPLYPDPFSYNMWQTYPDRKKPSVTYRGKFAGKARSRAAGGAPIYGRMVHKAPAGSRLRNGMRHRTKAFEDVTRLYGTVNRFPQSSRRRLTTSRVGGGGFPAIPHIPQAGRFQHLKELIRAEHARELQEQHMEDIEDKVNTLEHERRPGIQQPRKQFLDPLPPLQMPTKMNYEFGQGRYGSNVPNIGQAWSRSGPQTREYMLN